MGKKRLILSFALLILFWGLVWPASKVALVSSPPLWFAGLRVLLSGVLLLAWNFARRRPQPIRWAPNLLLALFNVAFFYGLQMLALDHLAAGMLSTLVYIQPVLTVLMARMWLGEALSPLKILGVVLGFLGIVAISLGGISAHAPVLSVLLGLGAGISWAVGTVLYKRWGKAADPMSDVSVQLTVGGLLLCVAAWSAEPLGSVHWTSTYIGAWLFSAIFGTALAWILWSQLIKNGEVSRVAAWTFLVPVLSTVVSVLALGETASWSLVLGIAGVILGTILVNRAPKKPQNARADSQSQTS